MMEAVVSFKYRGREISQEDILYIRALIERHPNESRRTLSTKLCEAWQWRQANGASRDMVCRGLLLWYYYLESKIRFPFQAKCIAAKVGFAFSDPHANSLAKRVKRTRLWQDSTPDRSLRGQMLRQSSPALIGSDYWT